MKKASRIVSHPGVAATPVGYHHGDLRNALVEAAVQILSEKGVSGLSLREVARRAGVSHAAPYHHFTDKEALITAVCDHGYGLLQKEMQKGHELGQVALDGVQNAGIAYARFAVDHPALFRLMYTWERVGEPSEEWTNATTAMNEGMVRGIMEVTGISLEEARMIHFTLWAAMHGLIMLWLDGQLKGIDRPLEEVAYDLTMLLGRIINWKDPTPSAAKAEGSG
ncbi:MAG TPA: TetR/AcrR family transcriptional regulator [Fibrobacteria bacterium]|nr:TetR/AcrR family transcriptional regulator [Fibrobacteria bacterium]